jgi:hypothetical protein
VGVAAKDLLEMYPILRVKIYVLASAL